MACYAVYSYAYDLFDTERPTKLYVLKILF